MFNISWFGPIEAAHDDQTSPRNAVIEIRGLGIFKINFRPSRTGRNPKSGEKVRVPEKYLPHFTAGKGLRP